MNPDEAKRHRRDNGGWHIDPRARILIAGASGMVGHALERALLSRGCINLLTPSRPDLELRDGEAVRQYFRVHEPDYVLNAAARVGGIAANQAHPGAFIRDNLLIQTHLLHSALCTGVKKFLFLASSCIYPKYTIQPMREEQLLNGALEPTNRAYAVAKLAGIEMGRAYRQEYDLKSVSVLSTNLYGPFDNFGDLEVSHVVPALIRKVHMAKEQNSPSVVVWGTGTPRREFLHVDDLAHAGLYLLEHWDSPEPVNVGVGADLSIRELAETICQVVGYEGRLDFDPARPDGTPRKLLDVSKLSSMGWKPTISLRDGLERTYRWFVEGCL